MVNIRVGLIILMIVFFGETSFGRGLEYKQYVDRKNNFTIKYPASWTFVSNPQTAFIFVKPIVQNSQLFRENINMIISSSYGLKLNEYDKVTRQQMQKKLSNYHEYKLETFTVNGHSIRQIVYEHKFGNMDLKVMYFFCVVGDKVYQVTCSTTKNNYFTYSNIFEYVMRSLNIEKSVQF